MPDEKPPASQDDAYELMPEGAPYEEGFNRRTIAAALFVGFVMLPGAIYLGLVTGQSMAGAAEWVTIIVFIEITKRTFGKLKTQEVIILYWLSGGLVMMGGKLGSAVNLFGGPFGGLVWDQYLIQSPQAIGLAEHIPKWVVPPLGSGALDGRNFFHPDWWVLSESPFLGPVLILVVVMVLTRINTLSLGYVMFRTTSDVERLPFPMAYVQAGGATALAETSGKTETWRWRVFSIGSFIGVMWGLIYVVVPTMSGIFLTQTVTILPIPFADFTPAVREVFPTAVFGLATNLGILLVGFVLPFWVVVGSFAASMLGNFVINPLLYNAGILHSWSPGMGTIPTSICNRIDFWLSFQIGTAVSIALIGFAASFRALYRRRRERLNELAKLPADERDAAAARPDLPEGRGDLPIPTVLLFWVGGTCASVILCRILVPDFPWYVTAFFGFIWTPLTSYIAARMIGIAGRPYGANFPYLREGSFYLFYRGGKADIWFAPIPMYNAGGLASTFKQLDLTKTKFGSLIKLNIARLVVMLICSFIFWTLIWRLAPIPSGAYPFVQRMWPFHATFQAMWAKSTLPGASNWLKDVIRPEYAGIGLFVAFVLYIVIHFTGIPVTAFYGFIGGLAAWPHNVLLTFAGAIIGRRYMARKFGKKQWKAYAPILLAGYGCGIGLIGMTSIAIALISKATSQIVY